MFNKTQKELETIVTAHALKRMGWHVESGGNEILVESITGPVLVPAELEADLDSLIRTGVLSAYRMEVGDLHFAAVVEIQ